MGWAHASLLTPHAHITFNSLFTDEEFFQKENLSYKVSTLLEI
jgi:hypothetical protein